MLQPNCFFASFDFFDDPIEKNKLSGLEVQVRVVRMILIRWLQFLAFLFEA